MRHASILNTIGRTPVVELKRIAPEGIRLYAKLESHNPAGSVKDRLALRVIEVARQSGALRPGQTVIEATSGNTGIALAMVCAQLGHPLVIVMSENFSLERRRLMRFLGAKVVLTPAHLKGSGMLAKAEELAKQHGWYLTRQFENEANAEAHAQTTALEILEDFQDVGLDYWVTGFGTGGTLKGVGQVLRQCSPGTKIIACEPDNSPVLASGIPQPKDINGGIAGSHPNFRPHLVQGWSADFIPKLVEEAVQAGLYDQLMPINGNDAIRCSRRLAREEGILAGISAGATLAGALQACRSAPPGSRVLCMLPDTGERYQSTHLFEDIAADMNEEEVSISKSTPNYRFDAATAPSPAEKQPSEQTEVVVDASAQSQVENMLADKDQPVVFFALEWCEFCWSARKFFKQLGIPYRSVDLDSVAYQEGGLGGAIRDVLEARLGTRNIPQIFISGQPVGGCTDLFKAYEDGSLQQLLDSNGIAFDKSLQLETETLLPGWVSRP